MSTRTWRMTVAVLWVAVLASALGVVYGKQEARNRFSELQKLINVRDDLDIGWGQLQLEQSTWATHARVEQLARDRLHMEPPKVSDLRIVQP
jgi:cell division protein FtsL